MKKTLLLLSLLGSVSIAYAQTNKLAVTAGFNESTQSYSAGSSLAGFRLGVIGEHNWGDHFSFQPGLLFTTKGAQGPVSINTPTTSTLANQKLTLYYGEIPVNFLYNIHTNFGKVFFGGGPYAAFGLFGNQKLTFANGSTTNNNEKFNGYNGFKNPDVGLNTVAGVKINSKYMLSAGYSIGMFNANRTMAV